MTLAGSRDTHLLVAVAVLPGYAARHCPSPFAEPPIKPFFVIPLREAAPGLT